MTRTLRIAVLPMALALVGLNSAVAQASPPPEPSTDASCVYTLTSPSVVTVSGTEMVTATLTPGPCTGNISMNSLTVCIEMLGGGRPECAFHPTFDPVRVYFAPYRSGATYSSTGRGCGNVAPMFDQSCSAVGPYTATL